MQKVVRLYMRGKYVFVQVRVVWIGQADDLLEGELDNADAAFLGEDVWSQL